MENQIINNHCDLLEYTYNQIINKQMTKEYLENNISLKIIEDVAVIAEHAEKCKGVLSVVITSLTHKLIYPSQDIRYHKQHLQNGYSGRTIDTKYITPFLKKYNFPHMSESGWLTRSLEISSPYDFNYTGQIKPDKVKNAFLQILHNIQENKENVIHYLNYLLLLLIEDRSKKKIHLAKPTNLNIYQIIQILNKHFHFNYKTHGGSRLPVLATYSAYQCLFKELKKYDNKQLLPLQKHNASDIQSGMIGDIQINDESGRIFEAFEIKHGIRFEDQYIVDIYDKFKIYPIKKYYLLSTLHNHQNKFEKSIQRIHKLHGCDVIIENVIDHIFNILKYLNQPYEFINAYVENLMIDQTIKYEHKIKWNDIITDI